MKSSNDVRPALAVRFWSPAIGGRGFEGRTFECATCERTEKISVTVDPMKSDAVVWLAGELKPPR